MDKPKISIGIPAYNEEKNLGSLLEALLSQEPGNFELAEIIVVSDGSSDRTVDIANSFQSPLIKAVDRKERKGAAETQNEILNIYKGEVLVLLNADVIPFKNFLAHMCQPFSQSDSVGIASNAIVPVRATNFFRSVLNLSLTMKEQMTGTLRGGDNIYNCHGCSRAFSRKFTDVFRWKPVVSEDAFSYLECRRLGFTFVYVPEAKVLLGTPDNLADHLNQSGRFITGQRELKKIFGASAVEREHAIPPQMLLKTFVKNLFRHPLLTSAYACVLAISLMYNIFKKTSPLLWNPAESSKTLK
jgi:poly-beta-1,6-N-acetyl-D-glucosamine synthase